MQQQRPIPGIEGEAKISRASRSAPAMPELLRWKPSSLPLDLETRIPADRVVLSMSVAGTPVPKGRPQINMKTRSVFTPAATVRAQRAWAKVMAAARQGPVTDQPVGVLAYFKVPTVRGKRDVDNCLKLLLDAANGVVWTDDALVREVHCFMGRDVPDDLAGTDLVVWVR